MPTQTALTRHSKPSDVLKADSPGSSENTDDAYVHVDKADAAEADTAPAQPSQSPGNRSAAERIAAASSMITKPALSPTKQPAQQPAIFPSVVSPATKTAEATGKLKFSADVETDQAQTQSQPRTAPSSASQSNPREALQGPSQQHSAGPAVQHEVEAGGLSLHSGRDAPQRPQPAKAGSKKAAASDIQSLQQRQQVQDAKPEAGPSQASESSSAPRQAVVSASSGLSKTQH